MKILHYAKYYPPYFGGIEKVTYDLVESMKDDVNNSVEILCYKKNSDEDSEDNKLSYKIKRNKACCVLFKMPISIKSIFSLIKRRKRNDIIHVHLPNPLAMLYMLLTNIFFNNKVVAHWHSDIVNQKKLGKIIYILEILFLNFVDRIIVTSEAYANSSKILKKYKAKIVIIPIGIDVGDFLIDEKKEKEIKRKFKGKKIVFSVGRLTYYKGFEYLISAAKNLDDNYIILIGGVGEERSKLDNMIKELNLDNKVKLLGRISNSEIGAYFKASDVFCLPSIARSEAFGVVQLEAMSFGIPVISTDIIGSGVSWVNKNGESGIVVRPKSDIELSDAIKTILNDVKLYNKLSEGAISRFNNNFTSEIMNRKVHEMYQELLNVD